MVYTDRKNLTVLELTEERDVLSYDELIPLLQERPSNVVYVELRGKLYGIITMGRIHRTLSRKTQQAAINKHFTAFRLEESTYMQSRRIFKEKDNIIFAPVVDSDGKLLGEWAKEDDLTTLSYMSFLANNLNGAAAVTKSEIVLVKPSAIFEKKQKLFSFWNRLFNSKGISPKIINHEDIWSYCSKNWKTPNTLIFVDEAEAAGISGCLAMKMQKVDIHTFIMPVLQTYRRFLLMTRESGIGETDEIARNAERISL